MTSERHVTLASPPFWYAIHGPPLALPCLAGFLKQEGFSVRLLDLNVRMVHDVGLRRLALAASRARLDELQEKARLTDSERAEYTGLVSVLVNRGASGAPRQNERLDFFLAYFEPLWQQGISIRDLDRIAREDPRCVYRERFREGIADWLDPGSLALGISVACAEQLLGALVLAHVAKELTPQLPVILGGSVFSLVDGDTAREVVSLPYVDFLVRHEGEKPMAEAGCRQVSLGVESINFRVLELMDKGDYDRAKIERLLGSAKRAGIETLKIWLIPDFPTTTWEEAEEYGDFLQANRDVLDVVHIFRFHALDHTPIVKDPERFGIRLSEERERSVFGLHAIRFEPTRGMTRDEGQRMAASLRQRWSQISGANDVEEPEVDTRAILVGRLRMHAPVDVARLRHLPGAGLLVSADGALSTLVGPDAEHLVTALESWESFDFADAFEVLQRHGAAPHERLVARTLQSLRSLMHAGVVAEVEVARS